MAEVASPRAFLREALRYIIRPVVGFCLRFGLTVQEFTAVARELFVELAEIEIRKTSQKVNVSRISVLTGLYRQDVHRIYREKEPISDEPPSVLMRVLNRWEQDPEFTNSRGQPRVLSCEGEENEFFTLVQTISKAINPATVLFELFRNGTVERTPRGIKLCRSAELVGQDAIRTYNLVGRDIDALLRAVDENTQHQETIGNLHIHTEYDNIYEADLYKIRRWLIVQGKAFHRRARQFLAKLDKDVNPRARGRLGQKAGAKVILSSFALTDPRPQSRAPMSDRELKQLMADDK